MARRPPYGSTATAGTAVDPFAQNMRPGSTEAPAGGRPQAVFPPLDRGPQSVHSSDLFFTNPNMYGRPNETVSNAPGPVSAQLYPYHQQAYRQQFTSPPPRPQPSPNPYIYGAPLSAYGQQQPAPWAPVSSPPIVYPPNPPKRLQRPASASGAPSFHHSFSARPMPVHAPHTQPASNNGTHVHHPPYRTQSLFGQAAPPPPVAPPLPSQSPMHSNPYIGHPPPLSNPPPPPVAYNNSPPTPYHAHANNSYIGSNPSPILVSAVSSEGPFPPPPEPSHLPPKVSEEEEVPSSPESDPEELAMAIAISQNESAQRQLMEEKLYNQEEEDLARALAESLKASGSQAASANFPHPGKFASSSKQQHPASSIRVTTSGFTAPSQDSLATPIARVPSTSTSTYSDDDFDFGLGSYKWQPGTQITAPTGASSRNAGPSTTPRPKSRSRPSSISSGSSLPYTLPSPDSEPVERKNSLPKYIPTSARLSSSLAAMESLQQTETAESRLVFDDDAYARQLANEEEQELAQLIERKARMETERDRQYDEKLPRYSSEGVLRPDSHSDNGHSAAAGSSSSPSSSHASNSQSPPFSEISYESRPSINSVNSYGSSSSSSTSVQSSQSMTFQPQRPHSESVSSAGSSSSPQASSAGMLNPNHFVDRELLMGVSIGFRPPAILPKAVLMEDTMPNIISLPATRCPPLHLQAPDWQHLLRLMARLSNTRIEPTIESMAASKNEVKLRTVIQFIKPRANFNVWRTVLWFTIDHPIPDGKKFAQYHSGNPNLLPYSYVNEPLPVLLRDASDTNLSKTFTIPASEAVPLPTLPITFPNLALYLHAALQDSRRHSRSSEAASGLGKLGKMVQICYPNVKEYDNDDDFSGRSSSAVSGLFKRVIGRGHKDKRKGKTTNEETYQLVTPFVPDEWG